MDDNNNNYRLLENEEDENNNNNKNDDKNNNNNKNLNEENIYLINNLNEIPETNNNRNNINQPIDFIIDNYGNHFIVKLVLDFFLIHPILKFLIYKNKKILNLYSKKTRENFNKISLCIIVFCLFIIVLKINNNEPLVYLLKIFLIFLLLFHFYLLNKNFMKNKLKSKGNYE